MIKNIVDRWTWSAILSKLIKFRNALFYNDNFTFEIKIINKLK